MGRMITDHVWDKASSDVEISVIDDPVRDPPNFAYLIRSTKTNFTNIIKFQDGNHAVNGASPIALLTVIADYLEGVHEHNARRHVLMAVGALIRKE